jgi:membrane peptidoglycan carboxypeptidase
MVSLIAAYELHTSRLQAALFTSVTRQTKYDVRAGASDAIRFPSHGPYDTRLGYARLPTFIHRLQQRGFATAQQARWSAALMTLARAGVFPPYYAKAQAGLVLLDRRGHRLHTTAYPKHVYRSFEDIPPIVVSSLLFIENRELLDAGSPYANPAVEVDRLLKAVWDTSLHRLTGARPISGGSTLAVQLEKVRHSPEGRTDSAAEKGRQILSATLRAYLDGPGTVEARRQIVTDYLNTLPLGAVAGFGEVFGLGDGLVWWYGVDFDAINQILLTAGDPIADRRAVAVAYRRALSLLAAVKKPAVFLTRDAGALDARVDAYLPALAAAGVIPPWLRDEALRVRVKPDQRRVETPRRSFVEQKAADAVRTELAATLRVSLHELDRLDAAAETPIDAAANHAVTEALERLGTCGRASEAGLVGPRLLPANGCDRVVYSVTLYERSDTGNLLRVQTDTYDQPLNINRGTRLELGSTAKLRTLITYLEIVAELQERYGSLNTEALVRLAPSAPDALTRWALTYLAQASDRTLPAMLDAALTRRYSASPAETFFTGGGVHRFANFDADDDARALTVREAFQRSVNLVFIRLMRDVTEHLTDARAETILSDRHHPARRALLLRFADQDGRQLIARYYDRYTSRCATESATASRRSRATPHHPLEPWVKRYLDDHPGATLADVIGASTSARADAYEWLLVTPRKEAQDRAIRIVLEQDAFERMHARWRKLGYPFDSLVPSYATAIGSSGDNPTALSELLGIILNDGVRLPFISIDVVRFGASTPYETTLARTPPRGEPVLAPAIAALVRRELVGVVEQGTGRRLAGGITLASGQTLSIGGKTGTGDNRFEGASRSRVVSRTATFAFTIGDRFFGTIVAYVPGAAAANYGFTSALPVQTLKYLLPALRPLLVADPSGAAGG